MLLRRTQRVQPLNLRNQIVVILQVSIAVCLLMYAVTRIERSTDYTIEENINDNVVTQSWSNGSSISLLCIATSHNKSFFITSSTDLLFSHSRPLLFPFPKILKMESQLHNNNRPSQEYFQYISMAQVFIIKYTGISFRKNTRIVETLKQFCNYTVMPNNYRSLESTKNKSTQIIIYIVDSINFHLEDKIPVSTRQQLMHEVLFSENIDEFYELSLDIHNQTNCTSNDKFSTSFNIQYKCVSANIFSATAKGINNALSTLSQLVSQHQPIDLVASEILVSNKPSYSQILKIFDWPETHWRGMYMYQRINIHNFIFKIRT